MDLIINEINNLKFKKKKKQFGEEIIQKIVESLPFELNIPGYNYCRPKKKLEKRLKRGDKGINRVDEVCKRHDINYYNAQNDKDIRTADKQMLRELNDIDNASLGEKIGKFILNQELKLKCY